MEHILPRSTTLRSVVARSRESESANSRMLTVTEACERLRISKWMLYRLIRKQELKTIKIGNRRLISLRSIGRFVEQREAAPEV